MHNFMKTNYFAIVTLTGFLTLACHEKSKKIVISDVSIENVKEEEVPEPPPDLQVSAFLVFDDQTVSSFDILNDKSIALWNTIGGGGDALKPSHSIKVILKGKEKNVTIKVINGEKIAINKTLATLNNSTEFIVKNTGCEKVKVIISNDTKSIYESLIPFKCGE